jgi:TonB family protein
MQGKTTQWRDVYGRAWKLGLLAAVAAHVALFYFLPSALSDRIHEAMIPSPTLLFRAGGPGTEMEVVALRAPAASEPVPMLPEPEEVEEVEEIVVEEIAAVEETTVVPIDAPSESEGSDEGVPEGTGAGTPAGGGGGGAISPPRPLHLVVPRLPGDVDKRRARGEAVHLLVEVLSDGTVGEVRIEKGSRIAALNSAALAAARQMRYTPASRDGADVSQWTRAEMRF